ncbi:MAG: lytic transglycosylase domain-containing protein [Candidatus Zixiibacteriota bacterium]
MVGQIGIDSARDMIRMGADQKDATVRRLKLEKAAKDFESLFVFQLLKTMRASYVSDSKDDNGLGKGMFMSIADEALANKISETGAFGIADKLLEAFDKREGSSVGLSPDGIESSDATLRRQIYQKLPSRAKLFDLKALTDTRTNRKESGLTSVELDDVISAAAKEHKIPAKLIRAVIQVESSGDTLAVSRRGAKGLMQLTDSTASEMGVNNVFDPEENIQGGAMYLGGLMKRFSGNLKLALAAYNAGPGAVERHGGIPPYPETERYVDKVLSIMENAR